MQRVLLTGAAGDIGKRLRALLRPIYPQLRLSDLRQPADLRPEEEFIAAYTKLHALGWAHSVEVWTLDGTLAGGLYGVAVGGLLGRRAAASI